MWRSNSYTIYDVCIYYYVGMYCYNSYVFENRRFSTTMRKRSTDKKKCPNEIYNAYPKINCTSTRKFNFELGPYLTIGTIIGREKFVNDPPKCLNNIIILYLNKRTEI